MTDCPFQLNANNRWQCPDCNWVYPRESEKPPRRNCPNSPDLNSPEHRERIKQQMLAELQSVIDSSDVPGCDLATITAQLDQCLTPCKEFNGHTCVLRGSVCKKWQRWKEFLACTGLLCRNFEEPTRSAREQ